MKFRTLALLVLLALPLIIVPGVTNASTVHPRIWVNPGETKFWAPCQVSNEFEIEIKLWNKEEITGEAIYAFDFKVTWDPAVIDFVSAEVFPPWPEGEYFIVKDEFDGVDTYHLAITALDTAPPLTDHQLVLVKITFHVEDEPCYPDTLWSKIDIHHVKVSSPCGDPITTDVVDGEVWILSGQPYMWLDPPEFTYGCISTYQEVSVMIANLTKAKGFYVYISWNSSKLLEADIQCVHITDLFPPPYEYYWVDVGDNYVEVEVVMPCDKPPISCVEGPIVTICFHTEFEDLEQALPEPALVTIDAYGEVFYCSDWHIVPVTGAEYYWTPKREDLDLSCHVDITDLSAIAAQYGKCHVWSELAPSTTAPVDIYDIVVVAKKFCKTDP